MATSVNPYEPPRELSSYARVAELPRTISVEGRMSWADALDAQRLAMRAPERLGGKRRANVAYFWVLWVLFLLGSLLVAFEEPLHVSSYVFLGFVLLIGAAVYYPRFRLHEEWKRRGGIFSPSRRLLTQEGIERIAEGGKTLSPWSDFSVAKRNDRTVLLYAASGGSYAVFPRTMFASEDDWHDFVEFIRARFPEAR